MEPVDEVPPRMVPAETRIGGTVENGPAAQLLPDVKSGKICLPRTYVSTAVDGG